MRDTGEVSDEWASGELDLSAYLRRIGYEGNLEAGGQTLATLHRAHVAVIPFENADIILGRGVSVELPAIQEKLVHRRRGGYCFEHGLLLAAALTQLGYHVDRLLARVGSDRNPRTHLVLRVTVGGRQWLADTEFGTGLIEPLPFGDGTPASQYGWTYRLHECGPGRWQLQEQQDGIWVTRYQFDEQPQCPADILVANHFTATYPESAFVRQLVVIAKDTSGVRMLTGRRLSCTRPGHAGSERRLGDSDFVRTLASTFALQLTSSDLDRLTAITTNAD